MKKFYSNISRHYRFLFFIAFFSSALHLSAQSLADSLQRAIASMPDDTAKVNAINKLAWEYDYSAPDTALIYGRNALALSEKIGWTKGKARSLHNIASFYFMKGEYETSLANYRSALGMWTKLINESTGSLKTYYSRLYNLSFGNMGNDYMRLGNYPRALEHYTKALEMDEKFGNKNAVNRHLSNISQVYKQQGNLVKALEYSFRALRAFEELKNKEACASVLGNIGALLTEQHEYARAIEYYQRSLAIDESLNRKTGIVVQLGNVGRAYMEMKNYDKALDFYNRAKALAEELGNKTGVAINTGNIGNLYYLKKEYAKALEYFTAANKIFESVGDKASQGIWLNNIGAAQAALGHRDLAIDCFKKALRLAQETGAIEDVIESCSNLSDVYSKTGKHALALEYYKKFIKARDSLYNEENTKKSVQAEMNFEYQKKEQVAKLEQEKKDEITRLEMKKQEAEKNRQQIILWAVAGALLLVLVFSILLYNRFTITSRQKSVIEKQKAEVEQQKDLVEEKQKEIVDSITYARRLQQAILPTGNNIARYLPGHFIFYKPKDIVAGDFYWMEHADDVTYIAAADSTGHGVPGALVSVVCSNALNRALLEFGLKEPGKILDKARELVLDTFVKGSEDVKDGMDISLLAYDHKNRKVMWSGANNQLWYVFPGRQGEDAVLEIAPDKQPIGKTENPLPFTTHTMDLIPGTTFYLLTDGYADQFGGPKGKKFRPKQLARLLGSLCSFPLDRQQQELSRAFAEWKGDVDQVDDVTILGVKIIA